MATQYDEWLGKQRSTEAFIDPWNARALENVLDIDVGDYGDQLPGLWHWLYFLETAPKSRIGADGHPMKGDFLPPVENPRRMFAGGRTQYHKPLIIGQMAKLTETVSSINKKSGRSGDIYIVTVAYEYSQNSALCITEERDFIYLPAVEVKDASSPLDNSVSPVEETPISLNFTTDPATLFRFSALTFNSHRIHYDGVYASSEEGYPALVVHGPLSAILLSECVRKFSERSVKSFSFRAMSPLFCGQTLRIRAQQTTESTFEVVAYTPSAKIAVKAEILLS